MMKNDLMNYNIDNGYTLNPQLYWWGGDNDNSPPPDWYCDVFKKFPGCPTDPPQNPYKSPTVDMLKSLLNANRGVGEGLRGAGAIAIVSPIKCKRFSRIMDRLSRQ